MMIRQIILKILRPRLKWKELRGSWVLYAGWFELGYLEKNIDDGQLFWLLCIWNYADDGWHAVDFESLEDGIRKAENWAVESGLGCSPSKGAEPVVRQQFFKVK